ncbi:MAG: hypothetical protein HY460_00095 [Parcubacteria group bacterium]|nr:hypothetical protein [Parcubacteria group bacterium]
MGKVWEREKIPDELWSSHTVRAWVNCCYDPRFRKRTETFLEDVMGLAPHEYDFQPYPGGAKEFADGTDHQAVGALAKSLDVSRTAHQAKSIFLMTHQGCAAYGMAFANFAEERAFHARELRKARRRAEDLCPDLPVRLFFIGRESIHEID